MKMIRKGTLIFLIVEAMDFLTTIIGVNYLGLKEVNPLANLLGLNGLFIIKILGCLFIVSILQKWRRDSLDWTVIVIATPPVLWNITRII